MGGHYTKMQIAGMGPPEALLEAVWHEDNFNNLKLAAY